MIRGRRIHILFLSGIIDNDDAVSVADSSDSEDIDADDSGDGNEEDDISDSEVIDADDSGGEDIKEDDVPDCEDIDDGDNGEYSRYNCDVFEI